MDPVVLELLGEAYIKSGQYDRAVKTAREGLALIPAEPPGRLKIRSRALFENMMATHSPAS
jgi:hypothetical protein